MNISLKRSPFWNIFPKTPQPHIEVCYLYVFVDFVETWNGCGFPQDTPSILQILELPWLLCVWKLLFNGDCFSLFAMNAHIYAAEYHTPLNKTTSFSFHLKNSQCAYLMQGVVDFWGILNELRSNYWFYNIGKTKKGHTPNKLSSGQHKTIAHYLDCSVFCYVHFCSTEILFCETSCTIHQNGLKLKYICTIHVFKILWWINSSKRQHLFKIE